MSVPGPIPSVGERTVSDLAGNFSGPKLAIFDAVNPLVNQSLQVGLPDHGAVGAGSGTNQKVRSQVMLGPSRIFVMGLALVVSAGCDSSTLKSGSGELDGSSDVGDAAAGMRIIASGQAAPGALSVVGGTVYWFNLGTDESVGKTFGGWANGQIMKCDVAGCGDAPTALVSKLVEGGVDTPTAFAANGVAVYWSDGGLSAPGNATGLTKCAVSGCSAGTSLHSAGRLWQLAIDGQNAYWTTFQAAILTCPLSGCVGTPKALWSAGFSPVTEGIAVDATDVYWSTPGQVMKCALGGCNNAPAIVLESGTDLAATNQIALDESNVYIADENPLGLGKIVACAKSGCGVSPTELAAGLDAPRALACDGVNVYWVERGNDFVNGQLMSGVGSVRRCAISGCNNLPTTIVSGLTFPTAIALDQRNVYWADWGGGPTTGRIGVASK
jgi:hypothetical protein